MKVLTEDGAGKKKIMPSGDNRMDIAYRLRDVPDEALLEGERGWGQREMEKTTANLRIGRSFLCFT